MVDIIIPTYNAHNTISKTLSSIAYQNNVSNINVYIVNDASEYDYANEISFFNNFLNITELKLDTNCGPGFARQYGVDNSNSEFIMFIDADDVFSSPSSVKLLLDSIQKTNSDIVISTFLEETENLKIVTHSDDSIWLHGKIYRRDFLFKKNIRFNNTYANEDNGFNQLVFLNDSITHTIPDITYFWLFNPNSITRKNNHQYFLDGIEGYIYNMTWALEQAINNNCNRNKIADLAFSVLVTAYYYYLHFYELKKSKNFLIWSKELYEIYINYPILFEEKKYEIWNDQFLFTTEDLDIQVKLNPKVSFDKFLNLIQKENFENIKNNDPLVLAFSCSKNWYKYLCIELFSLLECTKNIKKIYLLIETEDISEIPYLKLFQKLYNVEFKLVNINNYIRKRINPNSKNDNTFFTKFSFGKLLLPDIISEDKVLYLDSDTLVIDDLSSIWNFNIDEYYTAGVKDWGIYKRGNISELGIKDKYINSGVVIFNVKKIKEDKIHDKWFYIVNNYKLIFPDQDALNTACTDKIFYLPDIYNVADDVTKEPEDVSLAKIIHYAGIKENWVYDLKYSEIWCQIEERFNKKIGELIIND